MFKSFTLQFILKAERCVGRTRTPAHPVWWPVAARFKSPRFFAGKPVAGKPAGPRVSAEHIQRPPVTTTIYVKQGKPVAALAVGGSIASLVCMFYEHKKKVEAEEQAAAERYYDKRHQSRVEKGLHRLEEELKSLKRDFEDLANKVNKKK